VILTRRQFQAQVAKGVAGLWVVRVARTGAAITGVIFQAACGFVSDLENWIPVAIASMNSIKLILSTNGFPLSANLTAIFNDIIASLNAVKAAAVEYSSITPPPVGALQKLQDAIKAVTDQLGTFLQQLNLPGGNIVTLIVGLAQIIISTIMAFANKLPPAPAGAKVFRLSDSYRVSSVQFSVSPHERSRRQFRGDWNTQLDASKRVGLYVPGKAYLHGWF
jgi:hypothetical protein